MNLAGQSSGAVNKQKIGVLKSDTNQKLPNGMYSKHCENFFKNIIVFCPLRAPKFKENDF